MHVWLFALPREEVGKAPASVYDLLGLSCRHECCQMSPIPRIPFTFKASHLCISVHRQRTRLVQGSGINHPLLSSGKRGSKTSSVTPEHKNPTKEQRSAVFLKPVLKVLLSLSHHYSELRHPHDHNVLAPAAFQLLSFATASCF